MNITANITKMFGADSNLKAFASVYLDNEFAITGVAVREGSKGLYVQMPWRKGADKDGSAKYSDIAYPITSEGRTKLNETVLNAYENALTKQNQQNMDTPEADVLDDNLPF